MVRVAVVSYPGSNCQAETCRTVVRAGGEAVPVWHRDTRLPDVEVVILPGGFSYGDYLRCGAIARFSPIMTAIQEHAHAGGAILGICNGFQILCEAGLLPGALVRNEHLHFVSRPVALRVERIDTPFTNRFERGDVIRIPVGHGDGRYIAPPHIIESLEKDGQIVLRYVDGFLDVPRNPNGALHDIAGVCDPTGRILGIMPHPERLADPMQGSQDGLAMFESLITSHTTAAGAVA